MKDHRDQTPEVEDEDRPPVLRLQRRYIERRIPEVGLVRFSAPSAVAEEALGPLYDDGAEARGFVNALVAACIESPPVSPDDVDSWTDRSRAIARVAVAEATDTSLAHRRLAGGGRDGDERLREAMRARRDEFAKRLRMTLAALGATTNVARLYDPSRLGAAGVVEQMMRQQRGIERLLSSSSVLDTMSKLSNSALFPAQNSRLFSGAVAGLDSNRSPTFGQVEQFRKLTTFNFDRTAFAKLSGLNLGRSPIFRQVEHLRALTSFAKPRALGAIAGPGPLDRLAGRASPSYFGALQGIGRIPDSAKLLFGIGRIPDYTKLGGGISAQFAARSFVSQYDTISRLLERVRDQASAPLRAYLAWVEREWAEAKAEHRPPPVLFVIASLPALVGLQLLEELRADDEPLLVSLEQELSRGALAAELQTAVQRNVVLDSVAKRHLAQAVDWIAANRYVDAAPPLYQGLERAFRLTARGRGVVDAHGNFLVPGVRKTRMRKIEDTFNHLGLDHLYLRFLHAWVFGEIGNLARHGDLPEVEHRQWVLRATVALVGWLEYVGGEADAVAELVQRLELETVDDADVVA
jgi:hypothetical protein